MKYKYTLKKPYVYSSERLKGINYVGEFGNIIDGQIMIYSGYSWDGCSVKFLKIGKCYIGTPDGWFCGLKFKADWTKYCSVVHDFLYQFHNEINIQSNNLLTQEKADLVFLDRLKEDQFPLAQMYYKVVATLGSKFWNK